MTDKKPDYQFVTKEEIEAAKAKMFDDLYSSRVLFDRLLAERDAFEELVIKAYLLLCADGNGLDESRVLTATPAAFERMREEARRIMEKGK